MFTGKGTTVLRRKQFTSYLILSIEQVMEPETLAFPEPY